MKYACLARSPRALPNEPHKCSLFLQQFISKKKILKNEALRATMPSLSVRGTSLPLSCGFCHRSTVPAQTQFSVLTYRPRLLRKILQTTRARTLSVWLGAKCTTAANDAPLCFFLQGLSTSKRQNRKTAVARQRTVLINLRVCHSVQKVGCNSTSIHGRSTTTRGQQQERHKNTKTPHTPKKKKKRRARCENPMNCEVPPNSSQSCPI